MRNKSNIGFVNAHAKSNGGDHDNTFISQKSILVFLTNGRV